MFFADVGGVAKIIGGAARRARAVKALLAIINQRHLCKVIGGGVDDLC